MRWHRAFVERRNDTDDVYAYAYVYSDTCSIYIILCAAPLSLSSMRPCTANYWTIEQCGRNNKPACIIGEAQTANQRAEKCKALINGRNESAL